MRQAGLPSRIQILDTLRNYFDNGDFYELLFDLGVSKNDIDGQTIIDKMRDLVIYMERRGRLPELLALMKEKRPHIDI